MSIFDASKYEGLPPELATKIAEDVNGAAEAMRFDFKKKMDAMDAKVKAANERVSHFEGLEPGEIEVLRKARGDASELKTALEALKSQYAAKEAALQEKEQVLQKLDFSRNLAQTIHQYNTKNPAASVRDDAVDLIEILAMQRVQEADGKKVFLNKDGSPIMKGDRYGGAEDFIEYLRNERPSLFQQPRGDGAVGSKTPPGSAQIPRDQFNKLTPAEQMTAIKSGKAIVD